MNNMVTKDPRLKMLVDVIKSRNAQIEQEELEPDTTEYQNEIIYQLKREYRILVERNNRLASALGACPYCWGTDMSCRCRGNGSVGSKQPNRKAFVELVLPVLERYGISRNERSEPYMKTVESSEQEKNNKNNRNDLM